MAEETKGTEVPKAAKRRWFRFSLRSLLVLVVVLAVPIAYVAKERRQSGIEMQIAVTLRKQGAKEVFQCGPFDSYELMQSKTPQGWWRDLARILLGERVFAVTISGADYNDIKPLIGLTALERLDISETQVSDLSPLAGCNNLKQLYVSGTLVSDLAQIETLENLSALDASDTQVSDLHSLAHLKQLSRIEFNGTRVKDVSPLAALTQLQHLSLDNSDVFDLTPLAGLAKLQQINLREALASNEQVTKLQQALPNCKVIK